MGGLVGRGGAIASGVAVTPGMVTGPAPVMFNNIPSGDDDNAVIHSGYGSQPLYVRPDRSPLAVPTPRQDPAVAWAGQLETFYNQAQVWILNALPFLTRYAWSFLPFMADVAARLAIGSGVMMGAGVTLNNHPSVNWEDLAQTDKVGFLRAVRKWDIDSRRAVADRIASGLSVADIWTWYSSEILQVYNTIHAVMRRIPMTKWPTDRQALAHDLGNRLLIYSTIELLLKDNDPSQLKVLRNILGENLNVACQLLQAELHPLRIDSVAIGGLHLSHGISPSLVTSIIRNILSNAAQHGASAVTLNYSDNTLKFTDNGAGMPPESLEAIRSGRRIHNDVAVDPDGPYRDHGLGWGSIRESCKRLGIQWTIDSEQGKGTTVTLTLPDGFLKPPDPH